MKNKGVIFGGGKLPEKINIIELVKDKIVIAADSGYDSLSSLGIHVDYLLGDFDSIKTDKKDIKDAEIISVSEEDGYNYTDMELAINTSLDLALDKVYLLGALGSRMDHSLANIFLLKKYSQLDKEGIILDDNNRITIKRGEIHIEKNGYKYFSVIPIYNNTEITMKAFKYPVKNKILNISDSLTVSNEIQGKEGIVYTNNDIIIIQSNDS